MEQDHETGADSAQAMGTRTSGRARQKSQRALEMEYTARVLAKQRLQEPAPVQAESSSVSAASKAKGKKTSKSKSSKSSKSRGQKSKKEGPEVYCICKTDGQDGRPMIECGICSDWLHFDCISLDEADADKIHRYVCDACEERTGNKTTLFADMGAEFIESLKSQEDDELLGNPRKAAASPSPSASPSESSGSSADDVSDGASDSDEGDDKVNPRVKRQKTEPKPKPKPMPHRGSVVNDRKASTSAPRKASTSLAPGQLAPARAHVLNKLTEIVVALFEGKMSESKGRLYAGEMETALWDGFKEVAAGKEIVGGKYKAQFNLISSSLSKSLRPDLREQILAHELKPAEVANLAASDLASDEQRKKMEQAKQAVLEQTVKAREDGPGAIRLGRDGLENAEDYREKEMAAIRAAEESAREKERRQKSSAQGGGEEEVETKGAHEVGSGSPAASLNRDSSNVKTVAGSPSASIVRPSPSSSTAKVDKESQAQAERKPSRSFDLQSAWGSKGEDGGVEMAFGTDQTQVDLSDIVVGANADHSLLASPLLNAQDPVVDVDTFESKPVVWSGKLINPAFSNTALVPTAIRHISTRLPEPDWKLLLPRDPIEITGRVPTATSFKYLSEARLSPAKELIVVALGLASGASDAEKAWWSGLIEDYIKRDRHAVYLPRGSEKIIPPGAAKELYLVPLRENDPSPEFTALVDGYDLPETRTSPVFLGVFVVNRTSTPAAPRPPSSSTSSSKVKSPAAGYTPSHPAPPLPPPPAPAPIPTFQNDQLQKLMASLASVAPVVPPPAASGHTQVPVSVPQPQPQTFFPMQQGQYQSFALPRGNESNVGAGYPPHGPAGAQSPYDQAPPPPLQGYGSRSPYYGARSPNPNPQGHGGQSPIPQGYAGRSPPPQGYGGRSPLPQDPYATRSPPHQSGARSPYGDRPRDNGWASRGGYQY